MYRLIFLGLIPGTHIQITFDMWLTAAKILTAGVAAAYFGFAGRFAGSRQRLARTVIGRLRLTAR